MQGCCLVELECEERLQRENENADRMREKMLKKIEMLPEEVGCFLFEGVWSLCDVVFE